MIAALCAPCHAVFKARLALRLRSLEQSRRPASSKSWYWDTTPPNDEQRAVASWFFQQHRPKQLWVANEWRRLDNDLQRGLVPEVVFLGRSNVGKSSLLNAILHSPGLNRVGPRPGKTKMMFAWGLSATTSTGGALKGWKGQTETRVAVLDAPGYGYSSQDDWGREIMKYLKRRKQIRRVFVLIDSLHGAKKQDLQMLQSLRMSGLPHQIIASKVDRQDDLRPALEAMQRLAQPARTDNMIPALGEILCVGGLEHKDTSVGVEDVQWAILRAAGIEQFAVENFLRLEQPRTGHQLREAYLRNILAQSPATASDSSLKATVEQADAPSEATTTDIGPTYESQPSSVTQPRKLPKILLDREQSLKKPDLFSKPEKEKRAQRRRPYLTGVPMRAALDQLLKDTARR